MFKEKFLQWSSVFNAGPGKNKISYTLDKYSAYFHGLNPVNQKEFIRRTGLFINSMEFKAVGNHVVSDDMRILIASGFVQITFGLEHFVFNHFQKILITPREYNFRGFKGKLLGHVDYKHRLITLSWENSKYGFKVADDAHNAVLHEMAHAIEFENRKWLKVFHRSKGGFGIFNYIISVILPGNYFLFDQELYRRWLDIARREMKLMNSNKEYFLKQYAAKNIHEYFACSVEAFFEQSSAMKSALPEVYNTLVELLNQDPLKPNNIRLN